MPLLNQNQKFKKFRRYYFQKVSLQDGLKLCLNWLIITIPLYWSVQALVQISYSPIDIEFLLKLISGFALIIYFGKFYWFKIPAAIFLFSAVCSFLTIGSDQLRAIEYLTSPKYSNNEIFIQISFDATYIALFFLLSYFEKRLHGISLVELLFSKE